MFALIKETCYKNSIYVSCRSPCRDTKLKVTVKRALVIQHDPIKKHNHRGRRLLSELVLIRFMFISNSSCGSLISYVTSNMTNKCNFYYRVVSYSCSLVEFKWMFRQNVNFIACFSDSQLS